MLNHELEDANLLENLYELLDRSSSLDTFTEALESALHRKAGALRQEDAEFYLSFALELQDLRRRDFAFSDED